MELTLPALVGVCALSMLVGAACATVVLSLCVAASRADILDEKRPGIEGDDA